MYSRLEKWAVGLGMVLVLATAWINIGIIAIDDYWDVLSHTIPAGTESSASLIQNSGFRSPLPPLFLSGLAHGFAALGAETPVRQLQCILSVLGLFSLGTVVYSARTLYSHAPHQRRWALALVSCFFLMPLFLTRTMIESLALPWVTLSATLAVRYWDSAQTRWLSGAVILIGIAALFRPQVGVCFLALTVLPILTRRWWDGVTVALSGLAVFLSTGWADQALKGGFHQTLKSYLAYNFAHSSSYGRSPFWVYAGLFLVLTLPPALLRRYGKDFWVRSYRPIFPLVLFFAVFTLAHSLVPHKEERFMIPILPIFLLLLAPLVTEISQVPWRAGYFWTLNFGLLLPTSFSVVQANTVKLCVYLGRHPEIKKVVSVGPTLAFTPHAYVGRELKWTRTSEPFAADCDTLLVRRTDLAGDYIPAPEVWYKLTEFTPGPMEAIVIRLNPRQNVRRSTIEVFAPIRCAKK